MKNVKELIEKVRSAAEEELRECNAVDTPYICEMIKTDQGKKKVIDTIVEYVGKNGMSIGEAINTIERESNPKTNEL